MAALVLAAVALAGCSAGSAEHFTSAPAPARTITSSRPGAGASIPLPDQALLEAQRQPNCDFKPAGVETDPGGDDPVRAKLDFERQCYRHAEIIVRARLRLLQGSVGETIKAVKRSEPAAW